jgi:hypothetical protein
MNKTCSNCDAYLVGDKDSGHCRARPPVPMVMGVRQNPISGQQEPVIHALFPVMNAKSWCREHQLKMDLSKIDMSRLATLPVDGSA